MNWTILKLIEWTTEYFQKQGMANPRLESELLLAHLLVKKRIDLYLGFDRPVSPQELAAYKLLIQRRTKQEPLQYITQRQEFWSLDFKVGPGVLIPRPETECLIEYVVKIFESRRNHSLQILDIGTGSGILAVVLAKEFPQANIWAVDISERALSYAVDNAKTHGVSSQIHFQKSDLFSAVEASQKFDLIISNPPYLTEEEWKQLPLHIREFEPPEALRGGAAGMDFHLKILDSAPLFLMPHGAVVLEIAPSQEDVLKEYLTRHKKFSEFDIVQDYEHRARVLVAQHG